MNRPRFPDPTPPGPLPIRGGWNPWKMLLLASCAAVLVFYAAPVLSQIAGAPGPLPEQSPPARKGGSRMDGAGMEDARKESVPKSGARKQPGGSPAAVKYGGNAHPGRSSPAAPAGLTGFMLRGALALAMLPLMLWTARRPRTVNRIDQPGFEVISPTEKRRFIPLEDRFQAMDFVAKIQTRGGLRLSANLNKVTLSIRRFGYLMEDKNYRNALLVNRRRVRRTLLRNGDVLDLGDLTLLYRDHREPKVIRHASVTPGEGKSQIKFDRPKGPVRKGVGMLTSDQVSNRPFYLTKNVIYIGRSEDNDLTIKSRAVYYRHAKIEKVGGRYKMKDLSILGNTFVNNRRIEQRFLKDGDEISIEMHRFKFQIVSRTTGERPSTSRGPAVESEPDASRKAYAKEPEEEIEEQESAPPS